MADVFERTVGLTADEVARLEELDRLNPGGKDAALFAEAAALAAKAQRAARARLGVAGGGPCRHCGTPLEANGTFEVDGRSTHTEAVCLARVVGQRQWCLDALHGIAGALDARRFLADAEAGTRKLTAPLVASMQAKAMTDVAIRGFALDTWEAVVLALHGAAPGERGPTLHACSECGAPIADAAADSCETACVHRNSQRKRAARGPA